MSVHDKDQLAWWKEAIVYQIYPASFKDSTGSGTGDLQGIIDKLDYIASIGVNTLWICPFYKSPQADLGYDISDYTAVHEPYGDVKDVETIISESKKRGMKVLADLVVNHCSDEHPWFEEARKSKDSPKRDWFIWRPAKYDAEGKRKEPNNWRCSFGGSTWTWDEATQEYYYHSFHIKQPELNWENADCRKAIYRDGIQFWLDRGLAGFRVDTCNMYSKPLDFPDAPITNPNTEFQKASSLINGGPRIHEFLKEMRRDGFGDVVTIGELGATASWRDVLPYISQAEKELDMVIQGEIAFLSRSGWQLMYTPWKLSQLKHWTAQTQHLAEPDNDGWACSFIMNHDLGRAVSRFASDAPEHRVASAKMLAVYLLTLSGTPIIYQGDEIGMINMPPDWDIRKESRDCEAIGFLQEAEEAAAAQGKPELVELAIAGIRLNGRDSSRTPIQWTAEEPHAGFSTTKGETWMRVNTSFREGISVAAQENDPESVLAFYRKMTQFRKHNAAIFTHGEFIVEASEKDNESVYIFTKVCRETGEKAIVVLNWTQDEQSYSLPAGAQALKLALDSGDAGAEGKLTPYAAKIYM